MTAGPDDVTPAAGPAASATVRRRFPQAGDNPGDCGPADLGTDLGTGWGEPRRHPQAAAALVRNRRSGPQPIPNASTEGGRPARPSDQGSDPLEAGAVHFSPAPTTSPIPHIRLAQR